MPLTTPKSKTYRYPSWILAIASRESPLSRWWGGSLAQISGFKLEFQPGDQALDNTESEPEAESDQRLLIQGDQAQLESLSHLTESYVQSLLRQPVAAGLREASQTQLVAEMPESDTAFPDDAPEWQSDTNYCHRLYLGSLQVEPLTNELKVTTSQLYDLSELLHEGLKSLQPQAVRELPTRSPTWPKTAAAAAVAMGLTSGLAWYVLDGPTFQTAREPDQELISLDSPQGADSPETGINVPPDFQIQPTQPSAASKPPTSNSTPKTETVPATKLKEPLSTKDSASTQKKTSPANTKPTESSNKNSTENLAKSKSSQSPSPKPDQPSTLTPSSASKTASRPNEQAPSEDKLAASPRQTPLPSPEGSPEVVSSDAVDQVASAPEVQAETPESTVSGLAGAPPPPAISAPAPDTDNFAAARSDRDRRAASPPADTVSSFFQSQWKGQDSLDESLSYRIDVLPNGTVGTVIPQTNLSAAQIEQTPVPQAGAPLTAPFSGSASVSYEVTLYPDGTVSVK